MPGKYKCSKCGKKYGSVSKCREVRCPRKK